MKSNTILALFLILGTAAACGQSLEIAGGWSEGPCYDAAVYGSFLYYGNGTYIEVVNYSDPDNPVACPRIDNGSPVTGLAVEGTRLWAGSSYGSILTLYDLSSPAAPYPVRQYEGYQRSFTASGDLLFLNTGYYRTITILDVGDPSTISAVGSVDLPFQCTALAADDATLLAFSGSTIHRYNVADPSAPQFVCSYEHDRGISTLLVRGDSFFCGTTDGIAVFDLADPDTVLLRETFAQTNASDDLWISGDTLFSADGFKGVNIYDISTLAAPVHIGTIPNFNRMAAHVCVTPDVICTGDHYFGIQVNARSDLSLRRQYLTGGETMDIAPNYPYIYVASSFFGIKIMDITDPQHPVLVDTVHAGGNGALHMSVDALALENDLLVAIKCGGLFCYDVSDPVAPQPCNSVVPDIGVVEFLVQDTLIYITNWSEFGIVNISDPADPVVMSSLPMDGRIHGIAVIDSFAVLAGYDDCAVINVADPEYPFQAGTITLDHPPLFLDAADGKLYVSTGSVTEIYIAGDLPNPAGPVEVFSCQANHGCLFNEYIFGVSDAWMNLYGEDQYSGWGLLAREPSPFSVYSVTTSSDAVFISNWYEGFRILRFVDAGVEPETSGRPGAFTLMQNYPNPFNGETQISYALERAGDVTLTLYNVRGEMVRKLVDGRQERGLYTVHLDGRGLASGLYFYTLQQEDERITRKLTLIK
ncbi:T9SS type A sorting domain-containing protein [bacterium]|nr:T9SS type A sorting domain-containing protein [bacterium]